MNKAEISKDPAYEIIGEEPMNDQSKNKENDNNNNDKNVEWENEEEDDEKDKNENVTEAKDFMYFKRQCKFERFVTQMSNNGKGGALTSLIGGHVDRKQDNQNGS